MTMFQKGAKELILWDGRSDELEYMMKWYTVHKVEG